MSRKHNVAKERTTGGCSGEEPRPTQGSADGRVWKFPMMDRYGVQADKVSMPSGAIPRHVGMQDGWLCLWAEVDPDAEQTDRQFLVAGTGHPVPDGARYVGSTQDGQFVWHLYEVTP